MKSIEIPKLQNSSNTSVKHLARTAHELNEVAVPSAALLDQTPDFKSFQENYSVEKSGFNQSQTGGEENQGPLAPHPLVQIIDEMTAQR